jgi:hypothetical protein
MNGAVLDVNNMEEALKDADVVVHSGTTAALEAYYRGIPIYKNETELIDLDLLQDMGLHQYIPDGQGMINLDQIIGHKYIGEAQIDNILNEPVRGDVWLSLLQRRPEATR